MLHIAPVRISYILFIFCQRTASETASRYVTLTLMPEFEMNAEVLFVAGTDLSLVFVVVIASFLLSLFISMLLERLCFLTFAVDFSIFKHYTASGCRNLFARRNNFAYKFNFQFRIFTGEIFVWNMKYVSLNIRNIQDPATLTECIFDNVFSKVFEYFTRKREYHLILVC